MTGKPASVSKTGAVLDGGVISNTGDYTQYWVDYGPTTSYGSISTPQFVTPPKNGGVPVEVSLSGLQASTLYHYRFCARDSEMGNKRACGADDTFTTQSVECGQTVTSDVTLTGNLKCANEVGLEVGADGLDINLAGYTLSGESVLNSFVGVSSSGHDDVVVRNGRFDQWATAVVVSGNRNQVRGIKSSCGYTGSIGVGHGEDNLVTDNEITCAGQIYAINSLSDDVEISNNKLLDISAENGIVVKGSGARIVGNEVEFGRGLREGTSRGIDVVGSNALISDNIVSFWQGGNIYVTGSGHELSGNEVFGGGAGNGPTTQAGPDADGIFVNAFSTNVLLSGNNAHDNHGDGIEVQASSARLGDNSADDNDDFGIDAAAGVTDLGGNSASGNGNALQCRNVVCQ